MLEIRVFDDAQSFVDSLPDKFQKQIIRKIAQLADQPFPPKSKILEGYAPLRRLRSGDYRIIYYVDGNTLKVPLVDKRGDDRVYHRVAQKFKNS